MKVILVLAAVCVSAYAAVNFKQYDVVEGRLEDSSIDLWSVGPESLDDKLLLVELQSIEATQGRNIIEVTLKDLLESFRDVVINGNDALPPLDPLEVDHLGPYPYSTTGLVVTANLRDIHLDGLRWYVVDRVNFNILRLTFGLHMTIPRLTLTGKYDVRARMALFITHNAGGNFRIFVNRLECGVDARLGTNIFGGGHLVLRELLVKIHVDDTHIGIDGMTGSVLVNSAISSFVQNVSQSVIQSQLRNVSAMLSKELFDVINDVLKNYRLADIIG